MEEGSNIQAFPTALIWVSGAVPPPPASNVLLDEQGQPLLDEQGNWLTAE